MTRQGASLRGVLNRIAAASWPAVLVLAAGSLNAATYYVTVAGFGGEPDYEQRFTSWAKEIDKSLRSSGPDAKVETLYGPAATRAAVRDVFARVTREAGPQDGLIVMLIGHGAFDGTEYKINLPGPDISANELAGLLDRVPASRQLVVNMTSASGGSVEALRRPHRILITATKTGSEKNATVFARYWAEALRDSTADTDKNEVISAVEAFHYAEQKTKTFYETQKRLATEHAMLEDPGTGTVSFAVLRLGSAAAAANNPEKRALLAKREAIEQEIDQLKLQKAAMPADQYKNRLTVLLLQLARTQEELDK
jgi:hypothetical protein